MFLDLRKEYVTLNLVRILMTMESYGAGPHMCGILAYFWEQHHIYYFQEKKRYNLGSPRIVYPLQSCCQQFGVRLYVHDSKGQITCS